MRRFEDAEPLLRSHRELVAELVLVDDGLDRPEVQLESVPGPPERALDRKSVV